MEMNPKALEGKKALRYLFDSWLLCRYWHSVLPEACVQAHLGEEWKCFFAPKIYLSLKSKLLEGINTGRQDVCALNPAAFWPRRSSFCGAVAV